MAITLTQPKPGFLRMVIDGEITKTDIQQVTPAFEKALQSDVPLSLYCEFTGSAEYNLDAFMADLSFGVRHLGELYRIERAALVTDQKWLKTLARWEDMLFWKIDIKTFPNEERQAALEWASQPTHKPTPGVESLPSDQPGLLAFAVTGRISGYDVRSIGAKIEKELQHRDQVDLLLRVPAYPGLGAGVVSEKLRMMSLLPKIRRYAFVGPASLAGVIALVNPLLKMEIKHFSLDQEAQAFHWLAS